MQGKSLTPQGIYNEMAADFATFQSNMISKLGQIVLLLEKVGKERDEYRDKLELLAIEHETKIPQGGSDE